MWCLEGGLLVIPTRFLGLNSGYLTASTLSYKSVSNQITMLTTSLLAVIILGTYYWGFQHDIGASFILAKSILRKKNPDFVEIC